MIESIDSKLISVCLINDYSLIADLHILVYGSAECATISLECTMVKLLILNNFGLKNTFLNSFFLKNTHMYRYSFSLRFIPGGYLKAILMKQDLFLKDKAR